MSARNINSSHEPKKQSSRLNFTEKKQEFDPFVRASGEHGGIMPSPRGRKTSFAVGHDLPSLATADLGQ